MTLENDKYIEILETGLVIDHFMILCQMKTGVAPVINKRIQGFINLLTKKEYISGEGTLTEKALELIANCELAGLVPISEEKIKEISDFNTWATKLHETCRAKLKEDTGKNQYYLKVQGREYPYLPGIHDFMMKLEKFMRVYKYDDLERIEKCLLRHCLVRNQKLIYYIMREKGDAKSDLASDYENFEEKEDTGFKSNQKFV